MNVISPATRERDDLPLMVSLSEPMAAAADIQKVFASKDIRWQTWTDEGKDVHTDHHFDDE